MDKSNIDIKKKSLQSVVSGTSLIFLGTIFSLIIVFLYRTFFARVFTPSEYGFFSLGLVLVNFISTIGILGFDSGLSRQISYYSSKNKDKIITYLISWTLVFTFLSSIILGLILFLYSEFFAVNIFSLDRFSMTIKILSICIPFNIGINIVISIFRGFKNVKPKIFFFDISKNFLFLIFLSMIILIMPNFELGLIAYTLSIILTFIFSIIYLIRKKVIGKFSFRSLDKKIGKELFFFSVPLLFINVFQKIMGWIDTFMIGFLKNAEFVGIYNTATPLGGFISISLTAALFIFIPVISDLYSSKLFSEINSIYFTITKWICVTSFPLAIILILYSSSIIKIFFGQKYILAVPALQILSFGFFINNLLGPNGASLIAFGKTKFLMYVTFSAAILNIGLNYLLIPIFGIIGAASATIFSIFIINIVRSILLYKKYEIHTMKINIFKPLLFTATICILIWYITSMYFQDSPLFILISFLIYLLISIFAVIITRSIDVDDIELISIFEKVTNIKLNRFKKFLSKYM